MAKEKINTICPNCALIQHRFGNCYKCGFYPVMSESDLQKLLKELREVKDV